MSTLRNGRIIIAAALAALLVAPAAASAQQAADTANEAAPAQPQQPADAETLSVSVTVVHGGQDNQELAGKPVILRATRPKGPFEQRDPKPAAQWSAVTDASGVATFDNVSESITEQGLRLQAVTTHSGLTFKSGQKVPSDGAKLTVPVYEKGADLSDVRIERLRTIVSPWEGFLIFRQFWTLTVTGDKVFDTSLLTGKEYEDGLPLELPLKAKGIHVMPDKNTKKVNSIVYWKGVLKPGETVPLQMSFSMDAKDPSFVYEQEVDYPVANTEVVAPLEPQREEVKLRYMEDLQLAAPGFEVEAGKGVGGLRADMSFLFASGRSLEAGESFRFKLTNLPFDKPIGPWVALGLGILGALFVFGYGLREKKRVEDSAASGELVEILTQEREELLDELTMLEEDYLDGRVSELEYERESLLLRERIALVMKKLRDLQGQDDAA